jgi:A nuclease of the HNH/ENDO VII superfamily with conserved WHH
MYYFWTFLWRQLRPKLGKYAISLATLVVLLEISFSAYDFRETQLVLSNSQTSRFEKTIMITGTLLGIVIEGGGYGTIGNKLLKNSEEAVDLAKAEKRILNEADFPLVNGEKIINVADAGTFVTTKSGFKVFIKENGFPDFTPFSKKNVQIEMTGERYDDFVKANKAAGFGNSHDAHLKFNNSEFADYTWHHHEDTKTMQLVPKRLNNKALGGLPHTGGVAVVKHNQKTGVQALNFPSPNVDDL